MTARGIDETLEPFTGTQLARLGPTERRTLKWIAKWKTGIRLMDLQIYDGLESYSAAKRLQLMVNHGFVCKNEEGCFVLTELGKKAIK